MLWKEGDKDIQVRGLGLHVESAGRRGRGATPLLFIHGWVGMGSIFRHQLDAFGADRLCLAPDLPGHGRSAKPQIDYDIPFLADTLAAMLDAIAVPRAIAVGHSMGALVALELARVLGPERMPALALIEPAPVLPPPAVQRGVEKTDHLLREEGHRRTLQRLLAAAFLEPGEPVEDVARATEAGIQAVSPFAAESCWVAMRRYDGETALAAVDRPLAVIIGARPQIDVARWREVVSAALHVGQTLGAGHFNLLTVPDQVNAMLATFLARVEQAG